MSVWLAVWLAVSAHSAMMDGVPTGQRAGAASLAKMYEGQRYIPVGSATLVDTRAPGAATLLSALTAETAVARPERLVLGIFRPSDATVMNGFAFDMPPENVKAHKQALPLTYDPADVGGYSLSMKLQTGEWQVGRSGGVPREITPAVVRGVGRYYGLIPANETRWQKIRRRLSDLLDRLAKAWS